MAKVLVPTTLIQHTDNKNELIIEGSTVKEVLANLGKIYPESTKGVVGESGKINKYVNIFVDQEDIRFLQGEDTPVKENSSVSIIPGIAGGHNE